MQRSALVFFASVSTLISSIALADVGPPPSCPPGTHHVYHYGHKCEPDGGGPSPKATIQDPKDSKPTPVPTASQKPTPEPVVSASAEPSPGPTQFATPPVATASATPEPGSANAETPANPAPAAPSQRGCSCGVPGAPDERIGFGVVLAAMVFAATRRIRGNRMGR